MVIEPMDRTCESTTPEFHQSATVSFGELLTYGFINWADPSWHWDAYDQEQYERVCNKINNRFFDRDISIVPPGAWKRQFLRKMNEIMPKYKLLYAKLEDGINIFQIEDNYYKGRDIISDFPQTMLSGTNQDYASMGTDTENERVIEGDVLNAVEKFKAYDDVDVMILEDLDVLFSHLISFNVNGY